MGAALWQDVDPDIFEFERLITKVEMTVLGEGGDMRIERFDKLRKDRKPPGQIGERGIGGIAEVIVVFAPLLPGFVVPRHDKTRLGEFIRVDGAFVFECGVVERGEEEGGGCRQFPVPFTSTLLLEFGG